MQHFVSIAILYKNKSREFDFSRPTMVFINLLREDRTLLYPVPKQRNVS